MKISLLNRKIETRQNQNDILHVLKKKTTMLKLCTQKASFKNEREMKTFFAQTHFKLSSHQQIPLKEIINGTLRPEKKQSLVGVLQYRTL